MRNHKRRTELHKDSGGNYHEQHRHKKYGGRNFRYLHDPIPKRKIKKQKKGEGEEKGVKEEVKMFKRANMGDHMLLFPSLVMVEGVRHFERGIILKFYHVDDGTV